MGKQKRAIPPRSRSHLIFMVSPHNAVLLHTTYKQKYANVEVLGNTVLLIVKASVIMRSTVDILPCKFELGKQTYQHPPFHMHPAGFSVGPPCDHRTF